MITKARLKIQFTTRLQNDHLHEFLFYFRYACFMKSFHDNLPKDAKSPHSELVFIRHLQHLEHLQVFLPSVISQGTPPRNTLVE